MAQKEQYYLGEKRIRDRHRRWTEWGLKLAQQDPRTIRPGAAVDLYSDFRNFLLAAGMDPGQRGELDEDGNPTNFPSITEGYFIRPVHDGLLDTYSIAADRREMPPLWPTAVDIGTMDDKYALVVYPWVKGINEENFDAQAQYLKKTAGIAAIVHLSFFFKGQLVRCSRKAGDTHGRHPDCEIIFLANRKVEPDEVRYCSKRCANLVGVQKVRDNKKAREEAAAKVVTLGSRKKKA